MRNVEQQYESWCIALGENLSRIEYFERLRDLTETGDAVKRLLDHLQSKK
jgi:hypothetical protein